ncbi:MAG: hypothetical protein HY716_10225 [Planctomycetes bacterium]|nr:hypothetical protein [Planctomycetota bacterium]
MQRFFGAAFLAAFCASAFAEEPFFSQDKKEDGLADQVDQLRKRVAELEAEREKILSENRELRKEMEQLRQFSMEAAENLRRLRQILADFDGKGRDAVPPPPPPPQEPMPPEPKNSGVQAGPTAPLRARILSVSPEFGFIVIDKGEPDGIKEGWTFDILRKVRDADGNDRFETLGEAVFEKYVGSIPNQSQSKLKIVRGQPEKMNWGDIAAARQVMDTTVQKPAPPSPPPPAPESDTERKFKITGQASENTYILNYGSAHGARQADRVFVYRDHRLVAQLRLDSVERNWSAATVIDRTQVMQPAIDDMIQLQETKSTIVGRVSRNDERRGIWLDVTTMDGAKPGMVFEVRRQGQPVGRVVVKTATKLYCIAEPHGTTKREDIRDGDFVESVAD